MTDAAQPEERAEPHDASDAAPSQPTGVSRPPAPPRPFDAPATEPPADIEDSGDSDPDDSAPEPVEHSDPEQGEFFEDIDALPALLEAILFVADHPLDDAYLARALEVSAPRVRRALDDLAEGLREQQRGIRLQTGPDGAQLVSAPEAAAQVERFLGLEANRRLSTAALETLAIVAYRQPITRGQIDTIRGVSSDGAIQTLRARGLIEPAGHAAGPGRPMLFRTSQRFLEHFGLERPGQLPPLPDDVDLPAAEISEQLGLDQALVEEVMAQATAAELEADTVEGEASIPEPHGDHERADDADDETAPDPEDTSDEGVMISHDLDALTAAAGQAFAALATPEPPEDDDTPAER